jgi:signal transduction histidine kinase
MQSENSSPAARTAGPAPGGEFPAAVLESLPFPAFAVDGDLRLLYTNRVDDLLRLLSDPPPPGIALHTRDAGGGDVGESARARLRKLVRAVLERAGGSHSHTSSTADLVWHMAGAERRWRLTLAPILTGEGPPRSVVITFHQYLGEASGEEPDLAHEAAQLDMARQLAATLNHEINNPLFIVSATLEDVLAETQDPEMERRLKGALDAVWRVASSVKQLQEIRQVVTTTYISGFPMIDLEASVEPRKPSSG